MEAQYVTYALTETQATSFEAGDRKSYIHPDRSQDIVDYDAAVISWHAERSARKWRNKSFVACIAVDTYTNSVIQYKRLHP